MMNNPSYTGEFKVQRPNMGEPAGYTGQPAAYTGQPAPYMGQPTAHTGQPAPYMGQPTAHTGQPAPYMGQPTAHTGQPAPYMGQPVNYMGEHPPSLTGESSGINSEKVAFEMVDILPQAGSRQLKEIFKSVTGFFMFTSLGFSFICLILMSLYWGDRVERKAKWFDTIYVIACIITMLVELAIIITIAVKRNDINNKVVHIVFAGLSALSAVMFLVGTIGCLPFTSVTKSNSYDGGYYDTYYGEYRSQIHYYYYTSYRMYFVPAELLGFMTILLLIQQMAFHIRDYKIDTRVPEVNHVQPHGRRVKDIFLSAVGFLTTSSLVFSILCIITMSSFFASERLYNWASYFYIYASCHTLATEIIILTVMIATRRGQRNTLIHKIFVALCLLCSILLVIGTISCFSLFNSVILDNYDYGNGYLYYYGAYRQESYYLGGGMLGIMNVILLIQQIIFHVREIQCALT